MPIYHYVCETCDFDEEIIHSIKECDKDLNCLYSEKKDCKLRRVIGETSFNFFGSLSPTQKKEVLKKRSKEHFKSKLEDEFHQKNKRDYIP